MQLCNRIAVSLLIVLFVGCGDQVPELVQVSGKVTINGQPLPNALVSFVPMADGLNSHHKSIGTTDQDGAFSLKTYAGLDGAYACMNKITVVDGPAPEEARSMDESGAVKWNEYKASLKNRPIPKEYMTLGQTPLEIQVNTEQLEYNIELKR